MKLSKYPHVMIDLETMGLESDAAIVSIGAVLFDPVAKIINRNNEFYMELDWRNQGREITPSTVKWWAERTTPTARLALEGSTDLSKALTELTKWLPKSVKVWANSPSFDLAKLRHAYANELLEETPWKFWEERDFRTIRDCYRDARGEIGTPAKVPTHNAVEDAISQAEQLFKIYHIFNKVK